MPAMSEMTTLLIWIQWIQMASQKIAFVGSGLFAGAVLYRARYCMPAGGNSDIGMELRLFHIKSSGPDKWLSGIAFVVAGAAALACLSGGGMLWLVAALAEGLAAIYLLAEIGRARHELMKADPVAGFLAIAWLERWRRQQVWLAVNAAWVPWLLVFQL